MRVRQSFSLKWIDRSLLLYTNVVTRCIFGTQHEKEEIADREATNSFTPEKLIAIRGACNLYSDHRVMCFLSKHGHTILRVVENTFSRAERAANRGRGPSKNSSKTIVAPSQFYSPVLLQTFEGIVTLYRIKRLVFFFFFLSPRISSL